MLDAANYIDFKSLIELCIKTIAQKFDFDSLKNTARNLKLDQLDILKHKSCVKLKLYDNIDYRSMTLEAVLYQLEKQYKIAPDMMNQIYKSIPLSGYVRLKASAKTIGSLFIAFTSIEAYTTNNEIKISFDHEESESIGNALIKAFKKKTSISHLLPEVGYALDDDGNKHLLNQDDLFHFRYLTSLAEIKREATHPYIFEYIIYLSLTRRNSLFEISSGVKHRHNSSFNRKDLLQVTYEFTKKPEGLKVKNLIMQSLSWDLMKSINSGFVATAEYLFQIGAEFNPKFSYFGGIFE